MEYINEDFATPTTENNSLECTLCDVHCVTIEMYNQHMCGSKHNKKVKRQEVERLWLAKDPSVYCSVCDLTLEPALMEKHLEGAKHRSVLNGKSTDSQKKSKESAPSASQASSTANSNNAFSGSDISCDLCSVKLKTIASANMHFNSKAHILKCVKKYFDEKKAAERNVENAFFCEVCDIALNGQATYESHLQGYKHNYKVTNGNFDPSSPFAAKSLRMKEKLEKMKEFQRAKKMKMKQQREEQS